MAAEELSKYVTLVSGDGYEFVVLREAANVSGAIRRMLDPKSGFGESLDGRCVFEEIKRHFGACTVQNNPYSGDKFTDNDISGIILEKVAEYFYFNYKHRNSEDSPDMDIPPELCLELLMAADFLDT